MAQQIIGIGAAPNDSTGDTLRVSMIKSNDNFTELYPKVDAKYVHTQGVPATLWSIAHNLGKFPSIQMFDSSGENHEGLITHIDSNNAKIEINAGFSGVAYCN